MGDYLGDDKGGNRAVGESEKVERAIVLVGLKKSLQPDQRGQQRCDPHDRRADARKQVEIGTDAKRDRDDHRQKNSVPVSAPPPTRVESRTSRAIRARNALMKRLPANSSRHPARSARHQSWCAG
jgi:hypothetical protein